MEPRTYEESVGEARMPLSVALEEIYKNRDLEVEHFELDINDLHCDVLA